MTTPKTLSIYGGGKLARTLARLWHDAGIFRIGQVICRSTDSAQSAVAFIGAGTPGTENSALRPADLWLVATADGAIPTAAARLADVTSDTTVVFHCSGSLASSVLQPSGGLLASVHPVHSFADPARSVPSFAGSHCTAEGEPQALELLLPAFRALGAETVTIASEAKRLYHAGTVMACNYLVTLMDSSFRCLQAAGIDGEQARALLAPLTQQTLHNCFNGDTSAALTGPIARRDLTTVAAHLQALTPQPDLLRLYRELGSHTLSVAAHQPGPSLQPLAELLNSNPATNGNTTREHHESE